MARLVPVNFLARVRLTFISFVFICPRRRGGGGGLVVSGSASRLWRQRGVVGMSQVRADLSRRHLHRSGAADRPWRVRIPAVVVRIAYKAFLVAVGVAR